MSARILEGLRVVELGMAAVGPWAAKLLGALGAEVIKMEDPAGEISHSVPPYIAGTSALYISANLNKRNIVVDLKDPKQHEQALALIGAADIFVENYRPGVVDRLGIGYGVLSKLNPRLIMVSASAYGATGPMGNFAGADPFVQAFCGWCSITGAAATRGEMLRYLAHLDVTTATVITEAVLHALVAREKSGSGQHISIEMLTSALSIQTTRVAEFFATGVQPLPRGSAAATTVPHQAFLCRDQEYLAVGVVTAEQWPAFCKAMQLEELCDDVRFKSNADRVGNRELLLPLLRERFASKPSAWWGMRLTRERVPNGRFLDFAALLHHSQVTQNGFITKTATANWGEVLTEALPWRFERTPAGPQFGGGSKGQHTAQVLRELADGSYPRQDAGGTREFGTEGRTGALSGFTVLDLSQGLCGPFAAARLGDSGMTVIKVEPIAGDASRSMGPPFVGDQSATFMSINRNKRSIAVDLDSAEGRAIVHQLIAQADVVLEDWGPGVADARQYRYDELRLTHQGLIWCSITPFGENGPLSDMPGAELVLQAMSDYPNSLGEHGQEPVRVGADIANLNTSIMASQAIGAALFHRLRGGQGQRVSVSMLGTLLHIRGIMWTSMSEPDDWFGLFCDNYTRSPDRGYQTSTVPVYWGLRRGDSEDWDRLLIELDMLDYAGDPRFADYGRQATSIGRYGPELRPIWEEAFKRKGMSCDQVIELVLSIKGDAVPVADYPTLFSHPQLEDLRMVEQLLHPGAGMLKALRPCWTFSKTPAKIQCPAPTLGQHTDEILAGIGLDAERRRQLKAGGIVFDAAIKR